MKVNAKRLWERLQEVGSIGADPRGGISRFAWTPEYRQACELLMQWMREAGLTVRMDTVGNIFGRLEGKASKPAIPPRLMSELSWYFSGFGRAVTITSSTPSETMRKTRTFIWWHFVTVMVYSSGTTKT